MTEPPPDQRRLAYIKISAANFGATVYDTDDLSTVRGSSLTLLRAPRLMRDHLSTIAPKGVALSVITASASQLLVTLHREDAGEVADASDIPKPKSMDPPKGLSKQKWNRLIERFLQERHETLHSGTTIEDLRAAAEDLIQSESVLANLADTSKGAERLAQHLYFVLNRDSKGTFIVTAAPAPGAAVEATTAAALTDAALKELGQPHQGWPVRLFTFLGAWHIPKRADQPVTDTLAALDTQLNAHQLRRLTLPLPPPASTPLLRADKAVCQLTRVLPADPGSTAPGPRASANAIRRRRSGRQQKQDFYGQHLAIAADYAQTLAAPDAKPALSPAAAHALAEACTIIETARNDVLQKERVFAGSFHDIVESPPQPLPVAVRGKLCVVYLDGNGFGAETHEQTKRHGLAGLTRLSHYWEALGGDLLARLLCWMDDPAQQMLNKGRFTDRWPMPDAPAGRVEATPRYRFETLLWGGDEMAFVLPAWAGWTFLEALSAALNCWVKPDAAGPDDRVHFSIGAVFASYKSPIRELKQVAETLADAAKQHDRARSLVQVLSLESIDRAEFDLSAYRSQALAGKPNDAWFSLPAASLTAVRAGAERLIGGGGGGIGRSQLHRWLYKASSQGFLAEGAAQPRVKALLSEMAADFRRLRVPAAVYEELTSDLFAAGGQERPFLGLYQLGILYDYLTALSGIETPEAEA